MERFDGILTAHCNHEPPKNRSAEHRLGTLPSKATIEPRRCSALRSRERFWVTIKTIACILAGATVGGSDSPAAAEPGQLLWQIGRPDDSNAEFALAPAGWQQFTNDGFFVVGESDAKRDWPYVQPGPGDAWAGGTPHTFSILFGLKSIPGDGECRMQVSLLDTHSKAPPKVRIQVNGRPFERALPAGAGDDSVNGQPAKGKPHKFAVEFPARLLKTGDNLIQITTLSGCWLLYDWLGLAAPPGAELTKTRTRTLVERVQPIPALQQQAGQLVQPVRVTLRHFGDDTRGTIRIEGANAVPVQLTRGVQTVEVPVRAVTKETQRQITVETSGQTLAAQTLMLKPVRQLTIYVLPHSHTDIGYTEIQTAIEKKQVNNLLEGIACARRTANYPEGARFVWNVEVLWAADLYLHRLNDQQRADFFDAVKKGQVALNGMYLNELTGLCRPEELLRLFRYSTQLAEQCGVTIDAAMISDVPGYTWGSVTAMAQAGIKYFSAAPNYFDRIGNILVQWENKPFYWVSPSGREKVLVMIPFKGYALSHIYRKLTPELVAEYQEQLDKVDYPYDISYTRWSGHGDNAVPDPAICDFIKEWNAKYAYPKFIIASTSDAFRAFEQRYADRVPVVRGDWTPYWEDGAASSALETAMNRESSDRLTQAEALWTMLDPRSYPAAAFEEAWKNVLLYSEHTWGAHCSVWGPEREETKEQWETKRGYALAADKRSRDLLATAASHRPGLQVNGASASSQSQPALDVFNTASWPRTELVTLSKELSVAGDRVLDDRNKTVPSQRLRSGELAFLAEEVPPFSAKRFSVVAEPAHVARRATAAGATLDSGRVRARLDERTGGLVELTARGIDGNFADTSSGRGLNDYLYLIADDLKDLQRNGPVTIGVGEPGPLVASLIVQSAAPGCRKLTREVRVVADGDYVELLNDVDKERMPPPAKAEHPAGDYRNRAAKESVNFAFEFNVPAGDIRLDVPLGVMRPEADQMPSACKNWFTVGRWADVANRDRGIQWVTLDAPLVQVGGLTATLLNSQTNPDVWRKTVAPTQKLYSWAMNNHWGTNYRAYQEGPTRFRFILRPYRKSNPITNSRFAIAFSQPLLPLPARGPKPDQSPVLRVSSEDALVTGLKPSDDGLAIIVRLFGASGKTQTTRLTWAEPKPRRVWLSNTSERPGRPVSNAVEVPGYGVVTLRAEFPN